MANDVEIIDSRIQKIQSTIVELQELFRLILIDVQSLERRNVQLSSRDDIVAEIMAKIPKSPDMPVTSKPKHDPSIKKIEKKPRVPIDFDKLDFLIKEGKSTKEIISLMPVGKTTVENQKKKYRQKKNETSGDQTASLGTDKA